MENTTQPVARLGLQYKREEGELCIYVKCFAGLPLAVGPRGLNCAARLFVLKEVKHRWIPSRRFAVINVQERNDDSRVVMETLAVRRHASVVFNEFFTCQLPQQLFHHCAMRIQFCHVHRNQQETAIAEADYWIDENPIDSFTEYDIPMHITTPDLGEVEIGICYLPTSERLLVTILQVTNLALLNPTLSKVFVYVHVLVCGLTMEKRRTPPAKGPDTRFDALFTFDVSLEEHPSTLLAVTVAEELPISTANDENANPTELSAKERMSTVGRVLLGRVHGAERTHWARMLRAPRERHVEVHKLGPC